MKKNKAEKLIDLYKDWMGTGAIPRMGLCIVLDYYCMFEELELLALFEPSDKECLKLRKDGESVSYWASGLQVEDHSKSFTFTERRQNIVLFICAMRGQL